MQLLSEAGVRESLFRAAIAVMTVWSVYCLLDLIYVLLGYFSLAPGLPLLAIFSEPRVEPGFWGDYLKRLSASWGAIVTGLGVVALLLRPPVQVVEAEETGPVASYPIIPEAERTEPRLLYTDEGTDDLSEQPQPRAAIRREAPRRAEPGAAGIRLEPEPPPPGGMETEPRREAELRRRDLGTPWLSAERRIEPGPKQAWSEPELRDGGKESRWGEPQARRSEEPRPLRREPLPETRQDEGTAPRSHPTRSAPFLRALRGRSGAAAQPQQETPAEFEPPPRQPVTPQPRRPESPRLFAGAAAEEFSFFEVRYEDGTATVERVRRAEFSGDEAVAISLVRRRIAEETAAGRRPAKTVAAVTPISYFGFPNR